MQALLLAPPHCGFSGSYSAFNGGQISESKLTGVWGLFDENSLDYGAAGLLNRLLVPTCDATRSKSQPRSARRAASRQYDNPSCSGTVTLTA